jgi:hypothetical protein
LREARLHGLALGFGTRGQRRARDNPTRSDDAGLPVFQANNRGSPRSPPEKTAQIRYNAKLRSLAAARRLSACFARHR